MSLNAPHLFSLAGAALLLSGCVTAWENGHKVLSISGNVRGLHYRSANGTTLDADAIDNAAAHRAVGNAISKVTLSAGTAAATAGTLFLAP